MEPLDQHIAEVLADDAAPAELQGPARVLIVGSAITGAMISDALAARATAAPGPHDHTHRCTIVNKLEEAKAIVARRRFDVITLATELPDGEGFDLVPLVQKTNPATKIIITAPAVSAAAAVQALRCGAADFITLPADRLELARRLDAALIKSRVDRQRDERLLKLKKVCRELNIARTEISKQVDGLCDDLVNAYHDIAEQMNEVAMSSEFRTLLKQELDVEDLLRTTLEYLLTKTGPTNAAVFLPDSADHYGLGAYVNYDCPRESIAALLDHLCGAICPQMAGENDIVAFDDAEDFSAWIGAELDGKGVDGEDGDGDGVGGDGENAGPHFLADSQIVAFSCRDAKNCLAVFVLFRNQTNPFPETLAATLDTLRTIIGEQLGTVIKVHHRARTTWPQDASEDDMDYNDDLGFGHGGGLAA